MALAGAGGLVSTVAATRRASLPSGEPNLVADVDPAVAVDHLGPQLRPRRPTRLDQRHTAQRAKPVEILPPAQSLHEAEVQRARVDSEAGRDHQKRRDRPWHRPLAGDECVVRLQCERGQFRPAIRHDHLGVEPRCFVGPTVEALKITAALVAANISNEEKAAR